MLRLTREDLLHIAPRPKTPRKVQIWDAYTSALMSAQGIQFLTDVAEITTPLRLRHALAQWSGAETGGFSVLYESGAYTAAGILRVFGAGHHSSAVTPEEAQQIAAMPVFDDGDGPRAKALFERVYGYQTHIGHELGNVKEGDGYRGRGLGFNQMTGMWAYQHNADKIGCRIEDLPQPINLLHGACLEWAEKNCNRYADQNDAVSIRKLINAGTVNVSLARVNGLPETMRALKATEAVITEADFQSVPTAALASVSAAPSVDKPSALTIAAVEDVPGDNAPWPNDNQPVSLMSSTEMQAGAGGSATTGVTAGSSWADCLPRAFERATATGHFSLLAFLFALLSDPMAWAALGATAATGGIVYMMLKRYKRFHIWGI